jgi:hypothetical protein
VSEGAGLATQREKTGLAAAIAIACLCALGIALAQPALAAQVRAVKARDDVVALPPPAELRAATLGYKSAAADLLWAKLVVEYGIRSHEKRPFPEVTRYIDSILALDPEYKLLYEFLDTILVYTGTGGTRQDAITARRYFEQGTRARPYDPEMWLRYGQFTAFLGPSFLKDKQEIEAWRRDGALAIMRAVELGADPDRSLAASTLLRQAGATKANIEGLQRAYAMTDNEETRRQIRHKLVQLQASLDAETAGSVVEHEQRTCYPFLSKGQTLLIGPRRSAAACAGPASLDRRKECPRDWSDAVDLR